DIQVTLTRSPLEASLIEIEEIKERQPPYNVQLLGAHPLTWFCSRDFATASRHPDETHLLGPLPSVLSVRALGAIAEVASGEPPALSLRARAMETRERWAPDEGTFMAGYRS